MLGSRSPFLLPTGQAVNNGTQKVGGVFLGDDYLLSGGSLRAVERTLVWKPCTQIWVWTPTPSRERATEWSGYWSPQCEVLSLWEVCALQLQGQLRWLLPGGWRNKPPVHRTPAGAEGMPTDTNGDLHGSQNPCAKAKSPGKREHVLPVWCHLYRILKHSNFQWQWWVWRGLDRGITKVHGEILWSDECVHYLGLGDDFMNIDTRRQFCRAVYMPSSRESRLSRSEGAAVFISPKAWIKPSSLLPWGGDRCRLLCTRAASQFSVGTRL